MKIGIDEIKNILGSAQTGQVVRCNKKIARLVLMDGLFFWYGRPCFPRARRLCVGVWEVYLED